MDELDTKIVSMLQKDARVSNTSLAKELGVSEGTIRQRIAKMIKANIIKNFTISLGSASSAVLEIRTNPSVATDKICLEIKKLNINIILEVAGVFDIICFLRTASLSETNEVVEKIRSIPGVLETRTYPVLKEHS